MKRNWCLTAGAMLVVGCVEIAAAENHWLNIVPMLTEHKEEIAADTLQLYHDGSVTESAFILSLVPEDEPPVDKAKILGERFEDFRSALGKTDMPVGILLQSTLGHGWNPNSTSHFTRLVQPDGRSPYVFCPLDPKFQKYVFDAVTHLAKTKPDFFMVDDDFRLLSGRDGCFCPLHLARFNAEHGGGWTRESLVAALRTFPELAAAYDRLQQQSLVELAQLIRKAIDTVDPKIPCSFCTCAGDIRHAPAVASALAADGDRPVVRINNARYLQDSARSLPGWLLGTSRQIAAMPPGSRLYCEPDIYPHNRYSTSVTMFHSQIVHSLLSGCRGGKLWLSRTAIYEPASGKPYRKQLREYPRFYEALSKLPAPDAGVATVLSPRGAMNFPDIWKANSKVTWGSDVLAKMGIPVAFTRTVDYLCRG